MGVWGWWAGEVRGHHWVRETQNQKVVPTQNGLHWCHTFPELSPQGTWRWELWGKKMSF